MKKIFLFILLAITFNVFSQTKNIKILSSKLITRNEEKFPEATILIGDVKIKHDGITLDCKKAFFYKNKNFFKAMGDVIIEQGDSIIQYSDYADYNGNTKKAISWGNVEMNDPTMKLTTDTLRFDREKQKLFYTTGGTIQDKTNTLKSKKGTYDLIHKKFTATTKVTVDNPDHKLTSNHLDYYTNTGIAYLYGPSTITNTKNDNKIYTEKGFHNTKTDVSYFVKHTKLYLKEKIILGDSLYYNQKKGFASATNNIKVIDTTQNFVVKGNYAELYEHKDSLFITNKAVAISILEKDSMYVHGDKILVTGKPKKRIVRIFKNVKIFKSNLQGKCDSIHINQANGLTRMFRSPVLWSGKNQITGDSIQILSNTKTEKLDSLKILNNALVIEKDSLSKDNFNQIKGRNMYGKFINNKLKTLSVKGNAEVINFNRNKQTQKLETITKQLCSNIDFDLVNNEIVSIKCLKNTEGKTYPPSEFPKSERKLRGFVWRENERPKTMEDIFSKNEKQIAQPQLKTINPTNSNNLKKAKELLLKENNTTPNN
ncbi:OstA-like protein [Tenacibaculum sp. UWU-22]|uniref:OstA-like protein n=1 Tax=Tenacibaculum sp. UWU-22 TaxID=3234187 RepID=UPI0034DB50E8